MNVCRSRVLSLLKGSFGNGSPVDGDDEAVAEEDIEVITKDIGTEWT